MLFLSFATISVIRQVQADVRMVWIRFKWTCLYGPSVCRCIIEGQNGPAMKVLPPDLSFSAPRDREPCHLSAFRVIHPIHGNPVTIAVYEKHLGDRECPSGLSGLVSTALREYASTETLCLSQGRNPVIQWTERGAILPVCAIGPVRNPLAALRRRRSVDARSSRSETSSNRRPLHCPEESTERQGHPGT